MLLNRAYRTSIPVSYTHLTPGPIGINSATYVGYAVTQSVWGAVVRCV